MKRVISILAAVAAFACACSNPMVDDAFSTDKYHSSIGEKEPGSGSGGQGGASQSGILTAGEWNDLYNWDFWRKLMLNDSFAQYSGYWGFNTDGRVAVQVADRDGNALVGVPVVLLSGDKTLWKARTGVDGRANLWLAGASESPAASKGLKLLINGVAQTEEPLLSYHQDNELKINNFVIDKPTVPKRSLDIAFIVDATGSMSDEISFLKSDMVDILNKASSFDKSIAIRTAALFYRDTEDDYITKHQDFKDNPRQTADYIKEQDAMGGGDYPEAVHTALETALQGLSWDTEAASKIAFLLLDAPAHHNDEVLSSLNESIRQFASYGISIIPVAASGVDKPTEFMCRAFAIATGGTYVFLTNHSGVGGDHIEASVGEYKVELLNELLVRLITERMDF